MEGSLRTRTDLARWFGKLGFTKGAEIGVLAGTYAEILHQSIPNLFLYAIDPWVCSDDYHDYRRWKIINQAYEEAVKKLSPYHNKIIRMTSMDAVKDFADESLDFVYIDGNHKYDFVKQDLEAWTPKVKKSGVVAGHDYYVSTRNRGVIEAVDEYIKEHGYELRLTERVNTPLRDNLHPSWYFIKT